MGWKETVAVIASIFVGFTAECQETTFAFIFKALIHNRMKI
jgi:hypothetical protein